MLALVAFIMLVGFLAGAALAVIEEACAVFGVFKGRSSGGRR